MYVLAAYASVDSKLDQAEQMYNDLQDMARTIRFDKMIDAGQGGLCIIARKRGDWQTAYRLTFEILQSLMDVAHKSHILWLQIDLAEAAFMLNDFVEARHRIREALRLLREWDNPEQLMLTQAPEVFLEILLVAGGLLVHTGDHTRAVMLLSYAKELSARVLFSMIILKEFARLEPKLLDECRAALEPDTFDAALRRGKSPEFDSVLAELSVIR
jgi:hypothetical protein